MKTASIFCVLTALVLQIATAPAPARDASASQPAGADKGGVLAALERRLLGTWRGGPCVGDYTFNSDGTYELRNFSPGNNTLTGTWSVRWDALPPTLVVTCKTSDFKLHDSGRKEYEYLDKTLEIKLLELNSDAIVLRFPADKRAGFENDYTEKYERRPER